MTELPIVVSNTDVTVAGFVSDIEVALDIGPEGQRGSLIFSGSGDPPADPSGTDPIIAGISQFEIGDIYMDTDSIDNLPIWHYRQTLSGPDWVNVAIVINDFAIDATYDLTIVGDQAGASLPTDEYGDFDPSVGTDNTFVGDTSGDTITTGSYNTFIGADTDGGAALDYQTSLGFGATVTAAGGVAIGVDSTGTAATAGADEIVLGTSAHTVSAPGDLTVGGALTVDRKGDAAHSYLILDADAATNNSEISFRGGGAAKWRLYRAASTHDFLLKNAAGTSVLSVAQSDGAATFESDVTVGGDVELGSGGPTISAGTGSPEGVVTADKGSVYYQQDAGYAGFLWQKVTDGVASGWRQTPVLKQSPSSNRVLWFDSYGQVTATSSLTFDGTDFTTPNVNFGSGGPTITTGTAVPSASEPQGSKYIRTGSALGDHEYVSVDGAGTWAPTGACDTGVRDLSGESLSNGWTVNSAFFSIQRSGNIVSVSAFLDGSAASAAAIFTLPSGFRPTFTAQGEARYTTAASAGRFMNIDSGGVIQILNYGAGVHYVSVTFITDDPWPTSLPGA